MKRKHFLLRLTVIVSLAFAAITATFPPYISYSSKRPVNIEGPLSDADVQALKQAYTKGRPSLIAKPFSVGETVRRVRERLGKLAVIHGADDKRTATVAVKDRWTSDEVYYTYKLLRTTNGWEVVSRGGTRAVETPLGKSIKNNQ